MPSMVTVDWDFFTPHGMYDEITFPDGSKQPGMMVFDWQMQEGRSRELDMVTWQTRWENFTRWGLDIEKMTAPPLSVEKFALEVSARMDGASVPGWYGDSHAWAGILARDYADLFGPLEVFNFDAHHDLGYDGDASLNGYRKNGHISCENWALIGLEEGWISKYTIIYPDWLGRKEWRERNFAFGEDAITVMTWSKWKSEIPEPQVMHFCRSSSWTPPWLDPEFQKLREEFGHADCLDCTLGQSNSPHDTCHVRAWDVEEVRANYKRHEEIRAELFNEIRRSA